MDALKTEMKDIYDTATVLRDQFIDLQQRDIRLYKRKLNLLLIRLASAKDAIKIVMVPPDQLAKSKDLLQAFRLMCHMDLYHIIAQRDEMEKRIKCLLAATCSIQKNKTRSCFC